jgi:hypothetical protein
MNKNFFLLIIALISLITISSCDKEKKCGCKDSSATNYDSGADCDDRSLCKYPVYHYTHSISFYASTSLYASGGYVYNVTSVQVYVNGTSIGFTSAFYPSGPGNCICPGTVSYTHVDYKKIDWYSYVTLSNGTVLIGSGSFLNYASANDCTTVDVCPSKK